MLLASLDLQYNISLNKFASQKQTLAASTWIKDSAAMALLTILRCFLDFHVIGEETLFSPTREIINPPFDPPSLRFPNDESS